MLLRGLRLTARRPGCNNLLASTSSSLHINISPLQSWSKNTKPKPLPLEEEYEDDDEYYYEEDDDDASSPSSYTQHLPRHLRRGEHIRQSQLPPALDDALEQVVVPRIRGVFDALKRARRRGTADLAAVERGPSVDDYAAFRLDRTFASCHRVLREAACRLPGFEPTRVLDFGAYLGSGSWAAHTVWPPTAEDARAYTAVEPNPRMRAAGEELMDAALGRGGPHLTWSGGMPAAMQDGGGLYDLVIAPYSLSSLPERETPRAMQLLWERTAVGGVLAVVDSAAERGVAAMSLARAHLEKQAQGARLLAPFPHTGAGATSIFGYEDGGAAPFPMKAYKRAFRKGSTCELNQAIAESTAARAYAMRANPARRGNERRRVHESFVYLLFTKEEAAAADGASQQQQQPDDGMWGSLPHCRILGTPRKRTRHILIDALTPSGQMRSFTVTRRKSSRRDYRFVRKLQEGDTAPLALLEQASSASDDTTQDLDE